MATNYIGTITVTASEVMSSTGTTADLNTINSRLPEAQFTVEALTGVIFDGTIRDVFITATDAAWLKKATIFQTIFTIDNTDTLTRTGVSHITQDGVSVSAPDGLTFVLAPLARRALGNCSWAKSGTLKVAPADVPKADGSFLTSDAHAWAPMAGI